MSSTMEKQMQQIISTHSKMLLRDNSLEYIKAAAKVMFQIEPKEFNAWYIHFLPLYWKQIDILNQESPCYH